MNALVFVTACMLLPGTKCYRTAPAILFQNKLSLSVRNAAGSMYWRSQNPMSPRLPLTRLDLELTKELLIYLVSCEKHRKRKNKQQRMRLQATAKFYKYVCVWLLSLLLHYSLYHQVYPSVGGSVLIHCILRECRIMHSTRQGRFEHRAGQSLLPLLTIYWPPELFRGSTNARCLPIPTFWSHACVCFQEAEGA